MSKVRSARGKIVDFELMRMKEEIKSKPTPKNVEERERFIAEKGKARRTRRPKLKKTEVPETAVAVEEEKKAPAKKARTKVKR